MKANPFDFPLLLSRLCLIEVGFKLAKCCCIDASVALYGRFPNIDKNYIRAVELQEIPALHTDEDNKALMSGPTAMWFTLWSFALIALVRLLGRIVVRGVHFGCDRINFTRARQSWVGYRFGSRRLVSLVRPRFTFSRTSASQRLRRSVIFAFSGLFPSG